MIHKGGFHFTDISGMDGAAEFDVVQAAVHDQVLFEGLDKQGEAALGHNLTENHPRYDRIAGEVSVTEIGVLRHLEGGVGYAVLGLPGLVQQQHGLPVGEDVFDLVPCHPL